MIYKNVELHNVEEIIDNGDGSISWLRIPECVYNSLETEMGKYNSSAYTGVEIRFRMKSDKVIIRMATKEGNGKFHVYRGAVQGGWTDIEKNKHICTAVTDYEIERSENEERLKVMTQKIGSEWNSEIVRVIFDAGHIKLFDIIGDVEPPKDNDYPSKTLFCYGSSITWGSNSIDMSHSWVSVLSERLGYDAINKGMAGSCCIEPEFVKYIATEGNKGNWDVLILELGINVLNWKKSKIYERAKNAVTEIAGLNADKPIFVISPFYHCGESFDKKDNTKVWRDVLEKVVSECNYPNVIYINGLDILDNMTLISADFVHPNILGVAQIAERLAQIVKPIVIK